MKIGVVIVTHYQLGEQMLQALRSIIPGAPDFYAVSVSPDQTVDEMRAAISAKLAEAEKWLEANDEIPQPVVTSYSFLSSGCSLWLRAYRAAGA